MVSLVVFSTIGINVISVFCGGCNEQHSEITYNSVESLACDCCDTENSNDHCCVNNEVSNHIENKAKTSYLRLNVLASESSNEIYFNTYPFIVLFVLNRMINETFNGFAPKTDCLFEKLKLTGRFILQLNCVMRN